MIGYLKGKLRSISGTGIVIDVNGVGYEVSIIGYSGLINDTVEVFIHTYVREDRIQLYGFKDDGSIKIFRLLLSVKGVGPKVGQAILAGLEKDALLNAILNKDVERISSIPGIGKKGAERIILELRPKVEEEGLLPSELQGVVDSANIGNNEKEAIEALVSLGYKKNEAKRNVLEVSRLGEDLSVEELIKQSLVK